MGGLKTHWRISIRTENGRGKKRGRGVGKTDPKEGKRQVGYAKKKIFWRKGGEGKVIREGGKGGGAEGGDRPGREGRYTLREKRVDHHTSSYEIKKEKTGLKTKKRKGKCWLSSTLEKKKKWRFLFNREKEENKVKKREGE